MEKQVEVQEVQGEVDGVHAVLKEIHAEMKGIHGEVDVVHAEVDGIHGEVQFVDGEVEVTHGQVIELEDEFERVYTTIQDLFEKVDPANNVRAGESSTSARARYIRTTNLAPRRRASSSCDGCIFPALCRNCGVHGEASNFCCLACSLPVPLEVVRCELCGNPLLCDDYWCKDCGTTGSTLLQRRHWS
ncbi:hypothetical protein QYE76_013505 [Lolium multiflorum]|uniref:Uncharacterized protein n=1 Tax=Lolium multiflorum TaxID=4521 RepID=A0AAD8U339_LOLMU|nr:hypothetical protein QYE76_069545 [Lolium multiflorum]KAK1696808.1 hypothetical protein QYE76_013505 [Lolium multiflorum]